MRARGKHAYGVRSADMYPGTANCQLYMHTSYRSAHQLLSNTVNSGTDPAEIIQTIASVIQYNHLPIWVSGLTSLKAMKVLRDLEVPKLATCRRQRCSLHSTVSSPLIHYPNSCNLRFRLSCTSIAGNRLHKCTRSSTSLGSVQLYLSSAQLHSYSSCCARLLQQLLAST